MSPIWKCPNGCAGVRGPERPRRDNVCRYCLACSGKAGKLVNRSAPALDAKRAARSATLKEKRDRKTAKADEKYMVDGYDIRKLFTKVMRMPSLKIAKHQSRIDTVYRVGGKPETEHRRKACSGHTNGYDIHLSIGINAKVADAIGLMIHEAAHNASRAAREPWLDKDAKFGVRCANALDEWNAKYPDLQVDVAKWGPYAGKVGRRYKGRRK